MNPAHHLTVFEWSAIVGGLTLSAGLLLALPWLIRVQRAYDRTAIGALVRTILLLATASALIGIGTLLDFRLFTLGVVILVAGVMVPNAISRRRHRRGASHRGMADDG